MNLVLIGYRGTGKSTVARLLAATLGWERVDTDELIEQATGREIREIFATDGEAAFRDLESQAIKGCAGRRRTVIATGGGAVLRPENRHALRESGRLVWLTAPPSVIIGRLREDPGTASRRPPLTSADGLDEILRVLAEREPVYRSCADLTIDTQGRSPQEVTETILSQLKHDILVENCP